MVELEHLWPDDDRRDEALGRLAARLSGYPAFPERGGNRPSSFDVPTPSQLRVLSALSHGLDREGAAVVLGVSFESVKAHIRDVKPRLRAKTTTHAVANALRQGLIG